MSAQNNFDTALQADMDGLIAAAEPDPNGGVMLQDRFLNRQVRPRLFRPLLADHAQDNGTGGQISHSLFDKDINPVSQTTKRGAHLGHARWDRRTSVCASWRGRWNFPPRHATAQRHARLYLHGGGRPGGGRRGDRANSTARLIWSFLLLGLGLIGAMFVQVRVGLLPLRRVSEALARIRDGSARRLEGRFPAEIAPLAAELNSLIEHSDEVVGRARTHVSNLAHFLKTPLSVLASEARCA